MTWIEKLATKESLEASITGLLASFVDAIVGKRLTYARLIAKVPA